MNSAEKCRSNGWRAGDILEGDEGFGPERIKITAIGEENVLARRIMDTRGEDTCDAEGCWTLMNRDWKRVAKPLEWRESEEPPGYEAVAAIHDIDGSFYFRVTRHKSGAWGIRSSCPELLAGENNPQYASETAAMRHCERINQRMFADAMSESEAAE